MVDAFIGIEPVDSEIPESIGSAKITITPGKHIQISNYGTQSFTVENTGDKRIAAVYFDVSDAVFSDTVFDPIGLAGDSVSRGLTFSDTGNTGVFEPGNEAILVPFYGSGGTDGYEGMLLTFDPDVNGGYDPGEIIKFGVDMDPNSIVGLPQNPVDLNGDDPRLNSWDIGGVSGAELINSQVHVLFTDGTTAVGELIGDGSQGGSIAVASQDSPDKQVTLTVNGIESGSGSYNQSDIEVLIFGEAGDTARVVLAKGFIQPFDYIDSEGNAIALSEKFVDSPFPANNAIQFQTIDVPLDGTVQDITSLFDFEAPGGNLTFPGDDTLPISLVASIVDNNVPIGSVTEPIYLVHETGEPVEPVEDNTPPTASLLTTSLALPANSTSKAQLVIEYADDTAVNIESLDNQDIVVTGADGSLAVSLLGVDTNNNGTPRKATYSIAAPADGWQIDDSGTYSIEVIGGEVADTNLNTVSAGVIGSFDLTINEIPPATGNTIRIEAEDYKAGTNGVEYFDDTTGNRGGAYRNDDVDIEVTGDSDGEYSLGWIRAGEYTTYDLNLPVAGEYDLVARVATANTGNKKLDLTIGGETYQFNFASTGGWQNYQDVVIEGVTLNAGVQQLRLDMVSSSFNLNYIELVSQQPAAPDETPPTASLDTTSLTFLPNSNNDGEFDITYTDNVAIDVATIDETDITVTAPDGVSQLPVTFVGLNSDSDGTPRTATYSIAAPGGDWDQADNGEYTVAVNDSQVSDSSGNSVIAGEVGSFNVNISQTPPPSPSGNIIRIEAEDYKAGTNGVEYFDDTTGNRGGAYRNDDVDIEVTGDSDGEYSLGWIRAGEYTTYDLNLPVAGEYDLVARVATANTGNKKLDLTIGGETYQFNFASTGGWQNYQDVVIEGVTLNAGVQQLRLDMVSSSFNLNYIELVSQQPAAPDETPPTASLDTTSLTFLPNSNNDGEFDITYTDNVAIDVATIDETDITVTAPDGVSQLPVTFVGLNSDSDGTPRTATYSIAAPGGDWDQADNGEYTVAVNDSQVSDSSGNSTAGGNLGSISIDVATPPADDNIRINAGSIQNTIDSSGNLWQADTFFAGGQVFGPVDASIADTADDFIYQIQRAENNFAYAIPVDDGNYNINLHLSELTYTDFNQRTFDVSVEGELVFDNLDIFGETKNAFLDGTNTAKVLTVPAFSIIRDGELNLNFDSVLQDATIAGIEISPIIGSQVLLQENSGDTVVSEGGNGDSYIVVLNTQPTADVTIDLQLSSDLSADKTSLLFTSENWNIPQTVIVNAVDDSLEEGFETATINHTINTTDPNYSNLTVPSVSVDINDNDTVEIKFDKRTVANLESPTTGAWGPDGRLYVGTVVGEIKAYTFDDNYNVIDEQTISTLTGVSNPNILGIAFNPFETTANGQPKIYVSHSQLYANGGKGFDLLTEFSPYSGQVSVLEGPDFTAQPLITGIGVSNHDHGVNGLEFDSEGNLLIAVGGNTNAGIADDAIGGIDESPFTAAILKAEITKPDFNGNIEYELPADWTAPEGLTLTNPEDSQGFGGIVDVAPGVDVSVYASGMRNPYDLTLTTKGLLYATENGANTGFGDVSTGANTQEPFTKTVKDELDLVVEDGYYGHPNRNRGRTDPRQNVYYAPSDSSNSDYTAPIYGNFKSSTNGITEYRATTFNSQLRGNLLAQKWKNFLYNVELSSDGTQVLDVGTLQTQPGNNIYAATGLDVLTGSGGAVVGIDYTQDQITVATPIDSTATGMTAYDILHWRAPATGGSEFVIGGVNFSGSVADTTVTIGNEVATITSVSEQRITGILPSFTDSGDNLLDITVENNSEISVITDAFQPIFS